MNRRMSMRSVASCAVVLAGLAGGAWAQGGGAADEVAPPPAAGSGSAAGTGGAGGASAQPYVAPVGAGDQPPPDRQPPSGDLKGSCAALQRQDLAWFRGQCSAAIGEALDAVPALENKPPMGTEPDPTLAWTKALTEQMWPLIKRYKAEDLSAQADASHEQSSREIATNKRHVILAYGAMWLLSVGFLVFLWRRQQGLRGQIDELKRDLDAAIKGGK